MSFINTFAYIIRIFINYIKYIRKQMKRKVNMHKMEGKEEVSRLII